MDGRDVEVDCGSPLNPLANLDSLCASRICRTTDIKCGCTSDSHCPSSQVCYSRDNKCYSTLLELRTDPIEASACPLALELTEDKCLEAAGELEVGEFEGVCGIGIWITYLVDVFCGSIRITTWSFITMDNLDAHPHQLITSE